jgi:hypothetical protein
LRMTMQELANEVKHDPMKAALYLANERAVNRALRTEVERLKTAWRANDTPGEAE